MGSKSQSLQDLEIDPVASARRDSAPPQYIDLDRLRNADGIIAIISQRLSNRAITFAILKEFERDKRLERTSFFSAALGDSYLAMAKLVIERIAEIQDKPELMKTLQGEAIGKLDEYEQEHCRRVLAQVMPARGGRRA